MKVSQIFDCPPAGINAAAPVVAHGAKAGQRAGIPQRLSNLDSTGLRIVRRGCVVSFPPAHDGGEVATVKVQRVRGGLFWHSGWSSPSFTPCSSVRVIA